MKNIIIITFLLFNISSNSQNNEVSFGRYSVAQSKGYKIRVIDKQDYFIIELKLADSISKKLDKDKRYKKLNRKFNQLNSQKTPTDIKVIKSFALKYNKLLDLYTYYNTDTLFLKKTLFPEYQNEFDMVTTSSLSTLENKKNVRIVLDGHFVTFIRKTKDSIDFVNLSSPDKESNPLLMKFLHSTFHIYRNERSEFHIDKNYTFGL